jgi:hypothetical protein
VWKLWNLWKTATPAMAEKDDATIDRRLAPGIWQKNGDVWISLHELAVQYGWPDDPDHRDLVARLIVEQLTPPAPEDLR